MGARVSARGYTNVLLVLNMKRFVQEADQTRFERIRGKEEFAGVLREIWPQKLKDQRKFISIEEDKRRRGRPTVMTAEQVGFATGVFRSLMLERFTFPSYALDKKQVSFDEDLAENFQFKTLFMRSWNKWSIYIRPTFTGFFLIRLTSHHREDPVSLLQLSHDVLWLQESLDIQSALNWLAKTRQEHSDDPETLAARERSIKAFLAWLGVDETYTGNMLYYPLQWRLAMEVCGWFVEAIGSEIPVVGEASPIRLEVPTPSLSMPLHESYVAHHFTEFLADRSIVKSATSANENTEAYISVTLKDIRESGEIRQALASLMEGSILKPVQDGNSLDASRSDHTFPAQLGNVADQLLEQNRASWDDELCLLGSRTAIILPALQWRDYEVSVSSAPNSTLRVEYFRYWGAIERMIEFLIEIRVMALFLESASYDLLLDIAEKIHQTRSELFSGDIKIDADLPGLVSSAASLRHQSALCQSFSHPLLWSRGEFVIEKANYLLNQLEVPKILEHIERNINSTTEFVNHIDELYLADLSEKSNQNDTRLSLILAAASFTLTILILPSFWADLGQMPEPQLSKYRAVLPAMEFFGDWLAVILILAAVVVFVFGILQGRQSKELMRKLMADRLNARRLRQQRK